MATGAFPGTAVDAGPPRGAARPGALVWLLRDGRFGRVVATAQGGLLCRVRPEGGGGAVLELAGCELLAVREAEGEDAAGEGRGAR